MEPYNYAPPTQPQPTPDPSNQWFNSLPSEEPPSQKPARRLPLPLIVGLVVILILGSVLSVLFLTRNSAACLTTNDYKALTGRSFEDPAAFSATDAFYTSSVQYVNGSVNYANDSESTVTALLANIGTFYRERADKQPMTVSLSAAYGPNDTKEAASERLESLASQLVAGGVDSAAIQRGEPTTFDPGTELSADSPELATASVYLSVASVESCQ